MESEYLRTLRRCDDPENFECPPDFNWHVARQEAQVLCDAVSSALDRDLKLDDTNQDASYSFEIRELAVGTSAAGLRCSCVIILSNFGKLATVGWTNLIPKSELDQVVRILGDLEYKFIPGEFLLGASYDGIAPKHWKIINWWGRFFDYF